MEDVLVLLSTYNGEKYLQEQLDSLYAQEDVKVNILVRDDASSDKTVEILDANKKKGLLNWYSGANLGPARSFMDLVYQAPKYDWYAFCDQDDYWVKDKLIIAINKLKAKDNSIPALYYGSPIIVDSKLMVLKSYKGSAHKMLDFNSAMINSNATGCTMVFNHSLLKLIKEKQPSYLHMHDSWFHKVCIIAHGFLIYDENVHIYYRQHGNNVIGSRKSIFERIQQRFISLRQKGCIRSRTAQSLLMCYGGLMTDNEKKVVNQIATYKQSFFNRLKLVFNFNVRTNYFFRNILFRFSVLFGAF